MSENGSLVEGVQELEGWIGGLLKTLPATSDMRPVWQRRRETLQAVAAELDRRQPLPKATPRAAGPGLYPRPPEEAPRPETAGPDEERLLLEFLEESGGVAPLANCCAALGLSERQFRERFGSRLSVRIVRGKTWRVEAKREASRC